MTRAAELEALVERGAGGALLVRSPAVGLYAAAPGIGEVLVGGSRAGHLSVLGRRLELVLPPGVAGRVAETTLRLRQEPVEHGQLLLRLVPVEAGTLGQDISDTARHAREGLPEGTHAITSPTHGMFYRRPKPDAALYVEPGQVVETGATLGLIEVMKSFTAITYGGARLPPRAEVVEARADDGAEVEAEQVLFVVRPVPAEATRG